MNRRKLPLFALLLMLGCNDKERVPPSVAPVTPGPVVTEPVPLPVPVKEEEEVRESDPHVPPVEPEVDPILVANKWLYAGNKTKIYTTVMGWFGGAGHIKIAYKSDDPKHIAWQVSEMKRRRIDGAILVWYGPDVTPIISRAADLLLKECERQGLEFGIMIDHGGFTWRKNRAATSTKEFIRLVGLAKARFMKSPAYMKDKGKLILFDFGWEIDKPDFAAIAAAYPGIGFVYRGKSGFNRPGSYGAYSWPGSQGLPYSKSFNEVASKQSKYACAAVFKGFNGELASWGQDKPVIAERQGQTWKDSFTVVNRYWNTTKQLPCLLLNTWNDYEEGTALEPGIAQ